MVGAADGKEQRMNKNNKYANMCRDFIDHNKKLYCEGTFSRNEYLNICFGYLKAMRACQHISENEEKVLLNYI